MQQVDLGQVVLLLQHQREVGDAADGQLLLQRQQDVLAGAQGSHRAQVWHQHCSHTTGGVAV